MKGAGRGVGHTVTLLLSAAAAPGGRSCRHSWLQAASLDTLATTRSVTGCPGPRRRVKAVSFSKA